MSMYDKLKQAIVDVESLHELTGTDPDDPAQKSLYEEIMRDLKQSLIDCAVLMERNQELYEQNRVSREWKLEAIKRVKILARRKPSVALDQLDVLIDDIKFKRKGL